MNESEALDEMVLNHRSHPMACYYRSLVGVCQASTVLKERRGSKMKIEITITLDIDAQNINFAIMRAKEQLWSMDFEELLNIANYSTMTVFRICEEDIQDIAFDKIGRRLTLDELPEVKKRLEFGLEHWSEIVWIAIDDVVEGRNYAM